MLHAPLWITPQDRSFHSHLALDSHLGDDFCQTLEPLNRFLSFGRVSVVSFDGDNWTSQSEEIPDAWYDVALKITVWVVAWLLVIPGVLFLTLKCCYLERLKSIVTEGHSETLQNALKTAHSEKDPEGIAKAKMALVAEKLRLASSHERVVIRDTKKGFECDVSNHWMQTFLPHFLQNYLNTEEIQRENIETIQFFLDHFGRERAHKLFKMAGVDVVYYQQHGLGLSREQVVNFLALTGFVHIDDIKRLYSQFKSNDLKEYRYLSSEKIQEVKKRLENTFSFDDLDKEQYDLLWDILTFLPMSTMFVDRPADEKPGQDRGCKLQSIIHSVYLEQTHIRYHPNFSQRDYDYTLSKSLIGGFLPTAEVSILGRVFRQKKGYAFVHPMIGAAGCYCIPLEAMGKTRREIKLEAKNDEGMNRYDAYLSKLVFLPMQTFSGFLEEKWESIAGAFHKNIGAKGALAIWPQLEKLFEKPEFNRVDFLGGSMGGTQASKLAILAIPKGHVRKIREICSPCEDEATAAQFAEVVRAQRAKRGEYVVKIDSIWQPKDRVHLLGDKIISADIIEEDQKRGASFQPRVRQKVHLYLTEEESRELKAPFSDKPKAPTSWLDTSIEAVAALMGPHRDDVTLTNRHVVCSLSSAKSKGEIIPHLKNDSLGWEEHRLGTVNWLYPTVSSSYFADSAKSLLT